MKRSLALVRIPALERLRHGPARRDDNGGDAAGGDGSGDTGGGGDGSGGDNAGGAPPADSVDSLPPWAQKLIKDGRAAQAELRVRSKGNAGTGQSGTAGTGGGSGSPGANDSTKQDADKSAAELAEAQAVSLTSLRELAVFKAASPLGASADKLTDSRAFMDKVKGLDPLAEDFPAKLKDLIKKTMADHPEYGVTPPRTRQGADHTGGTGGGTRSKDLQAALARRMAGK